MKRPAFQFYPADWRKDMALQSCSIAARGLWMDLLCIAHECEPYGYLTVNGKAMTPAQIGRHTGLTEREAVKLMAELADAGVSSTTTEGVIFSRRMVRDESLRNRRAEGGAMGAEHGVKGKEFGKLGGNPKKKAEYNEPGKLYAVQRASGGSIKVGITKYLSQRLNGLRKQLGQEVVVLGSFDVADMGACEAAVHAEFKGRIEGEWISAEWGEVEQVIRGATHPPLHPPPSSSSSTSVVVSKATPSHPPASADGTSERPTAGTIPCPYQAIVDAYHLALPGLPTVKLMPVKRQAAMRKLWGWVLSSKKGDGTRRASNRDEALEWIAGYFGHAANSDFLMGRSGRTPEHAGWQCDIDFLLSERGMKIVIEKTQAAA